MLNLLLFDLICLIDIKDKFMHLFIVIFILFDKLYRSLKKSQNDPTY